MQRWGYILGRGPSLSKGPRAEPGDGQGKAETLGAGVGGVQLSSAWKNFVAFQKSDNRERSRP